MSSNPTLGLEITEYDEANKVTATFIQSHSANNGSTRIDKIVPKTATKQWYEGILDVFLPAGYPHSVTDDYTEYQIYDSLQAFTSSIVSLISSRAVLASVGVGDASASAMLAVGYKVLEQTAGRLATIAFAHRFGTSLEPECKMYRLLADVLNDAGFVLDCVSPLIPKPQRLAVLSVAGVLRALCGVAAGSAKASLSAHFAKQGNLGELNAKDSSQETVISLAGMLVGMAVVPYVVGPMWTWSLLVVMLGVHLEMNRRAVRAVKMRSLNRQRATIVFHELQRGAVPSPGQVAEVEKIFEVDGVLRDARGGKRGHCTVGESMERFLKALAILQQAAHPAATKDEVLGEVLDVFKDKKYLIWFSKSRSPYLFDYHIVLKDGASPVDVVEAWWQALAMSLTEPEEYQAMMTATWPASCSRESLDKVFGHVRRCGELTRRLLDVHGEGLREVGWTFDVAAIETRPKSRITLDTHRVEGHKQE